MKPRLFVGSSSEQLDIAYAIQQNLDTDAEVTVWSQGVFLPSASALESLTEILSTSDFGVFVFSADDVLLIRGEQNSAVRDNVILEIGLVVGALGRNRCFILTPAKSDSLRIPTDLVGLTPATFESNRSDGNFQAATGPACHAIRQAIRRLGVRSNRPSASKPEPTPKTTEGETKSNAADAVTPFAEDSEPTWITAWLSGDYGKAFQLLDSAIASAPTDVDRMQLELSKGYVQTEEDFNKGVAYLESLIKKYPTFEDAYTRLINIFVGKNLPARALEAVDRGIASVGTTAGLVEWKVKVLLMVGESVEVEKFLRHEIDQGPEQPYLYGLLADLYAGQGKSSDAREVLELAYEKFPDNRALLEKYAQLLSTSPDKKLALVPYDLLLRLDPENATYRTLQANILLELGLNDLAMDGYKTANDIAQDTEAWILANIGNLYKNCGLHRDGIEYLQKALEIAPKSEYGLERLAHSIKFRDEQVQQYQKLLADARRELLAASAARHLIKQNAASEQNKKLASNASPAE